MKKKEMIKVLNEVCINLTYKAHVTSHKERAQIYVVIEALKEKVYENRNSKQV